jgi:hypothetical protein
VIVAALLGLVLLGLAVDTLRAPDEIAADDNRFEGAPFRQRALWDDVGVLPGGLTGRVLGVEDDLDYRRTVRLYTTTDPSRVVIAGADQPRLEALRGKAILEVTLASRRESDPRRRSQLLNVFGVLSYRPNVTSDPNARAKTLRDGIGSFQTAVRLDPRHDQAKTNLELALRAYAASFPGDDPDAGAARGKLSGQGRSGSGY